MINLNQIETYLSSLQSNLVSQIEAEDSQTKFLNDAWQFETGGGGLSCVIANGEMMEKGGVNFSRLKGPELPKAVLTMRPELKGYHYEVMGVSVVMHPVNPYVPTSHMNVRFFIAEKEGADPIWWFGGGYDLTPYYAFEEDCIDWHLSAKKACDPFGEQVYSDYKKQCDDYFFLPHRNEQRGIGGIFYDYLNQWKFDQCFSFMQSVGNAYVDAYVDIIKKRKETPFGQREKDFQLYRRGRYAEFNLLYDRGTQFGLQNNGRTESILMSLPPVVNWIYDYQTKPNSKEAELVSKYLIKRDWL
ncbi:oxygen-dependent coproporphyrinogen oxidase [Thiotrichales bacterium 19S9-12]|nr:oxygen-dependent coproporphyrinogen oxidase [Thiotrichales bacterium 19S9-11]MCF6812031.1 oxygen-dependent coproporphyrinogen oxidase [Thiotrichales bacterium 19S9-12]